MQAIKKGDVVTVKVEDPASSNTYLVYRVIDDVALIHHPLSEKCLREVRIDELNQVSPTVKDSIERGLDFAKRNSNFLDYNTTADLEAISLYYVMTRKLTPRQKQILASICGTVASIKLNNNVQLAMEVVKDNSAVLDEYNGMWYRNFAGLFSGRQLITSKKQRSAIFNMAGFVMAELETPVTTK